VTSGAFFHVINQGSPEPVAPRFRAIGRPVRPARRQFCVGDAAVQHYLLARQADAQHSTFVRSVRTGDHRRTHPRQDVGGAPKRQVGRREAGARLRCRSRGWEADCQCQGKLPGPGHLRTVRPAPVSTLRFMAATRLLDRNIQPAAPRICLQTAGQPYLNGIVSAEVTI
jgi:hypothetical protein